jgi:hypothetical protein
MLAYVFIFWGFKKIHRSYIELFLVLFSMLSVLAGLDEEERDVVGEDGEHVDDVESTFQEAPLVARCQKSVSSMLSFSWLTLFIG